MVVRSKLQNPATSFKEVINKVVKEIRHSFGIHVNEVKPIRGDRAVILTSSVLEMEKVVNNAKFG